jgi:hypothetical protein
LDYDHGINSTFVDLTTDQNIAGNKIFEKDVVINALEEKI